MSDLILNIGDYVYGNFRGYTKMYITKHTLIQKGQTYINITEKGFGSDGSLECPRFEAIRKATDLEIKWLKACIAVNKYVECPKEEPSTLLFPI